MWDYVFESPGQTPTYAGDQAGVMESLCWGVHALQGENQELAALNETREELAIRSLRWELERHNRIDKIYSLLTAKKDMEILVEAMGGSSTASTLKAKGGVQRQDVLQGLQATVNALGECLAAEHEANIQKMEALQQRVIAIDQELQLVIKKQDWLIQVSGMENKGPQVKKT